MATYTLKGRRYLRKYTADEATPVYAARSDVQQIVDALCAVPWQKVNARNATMTYHTEEAVDSEGKVSGLDMNVQIRDKFDAALFCAEHNGSTHRAYANAAVYVYALPTAAQGKTLSSLSARVTSDPYNSNGCRLHVWTGDELAIPMACADVRGDDAEGNALSDGTVAASVAVRTAKNVTSTNSSGKTVTTEYWYPTSETATLSPTGGLVLKKYLFLSVVMESYATVRGNWIEGCSFISNSVSATLSEAVDGWAEGKTIDLSYGVAGASFDVLRGGVAPSTPVGSCTGERTSVVRADADPIAGDEGTQSAIRDADGESAASAVHRLYAGFLTATDTPTTATEPTPQTGVVFTVTRAAEEHPTADSDYPEETDVLRINSRVLVLPVVYPHDFEGTTLRVSYDKPNFTKGTAVRVYVKQEYMTSLDAEAVKNPALYDGRGDTAFSLELVGELDLDATETNLALPSTASRVATVVISAYLPPECVDLASAAAQGTGDAPFVPNVSIVE